MDNLIKELINGIEAASLVQKMSLGSRNTTELFSGIGFDGKELSEFVDALKHIPEDDLANIKRSGMPYKDQSYVIAHYSEEGEWFGLLRDTANEEICVKLISVYTYTRIKDLFFDRNIRALIKALEYEGRLQNNVNVSIRYYPSVDAFAKAFTDPLTHDAANSFSYNWVNQYKEETLRLYCKSLSDGEMLFTAPSMGDAVRETLLAACDKNPEIYDLLKYLLDKCGDRFKALWYSDFMYVKEVPLIISSMEEICRGRKSADPAEVFRFFNKTRFEPHVERAAVRYVKEHGTENIFGTNGENGGNDMDEGKDYIRLAKILGREDVLKLPGYEWFKRYVYRMEPGETEPDPEKYDDTAAAAPAVFYAMICRKWHLLSILVSGEDMTEVFRYLDRIGIEGIAAPTDRSGKKSCPFVELNSLSGKELLELAKDDLLSVDGIKNRVHTIGELKVLKKIEDLADDWKIRSSAGWAFGELLRSMRGEDACRRMSQLLKSGIFNGKIYADSDCKKLVEAVKERELTAWRDKLFPLFRASLLLTARTLIAGEELPGVIRDEVLPGTRSEAEADFVLKNVSISMGGVDMAVSNVIRSRKTKELFGDDTATNGFLRKYPENIKQFILNGGYSIATDYIDACREKNTFRLILKAAVSGKLDVLKYNSHDLERECGMAFDAATEAEWKTDMSVTVKTAYGSTFTCYEDTSFVGVMSMGEIPTHTCMSYKDGSHRECLLSCFDANKKVVYVKKGDAIIGRFIARITKCTDKAQNTKPKRPGFIDVESIAAAEEAGKGSEPTERPILFIERLYSGCQGSIRSQIEEAVFAFARKRAESLGIDVAISCDYDTPKSLGFKRFHGYIYITKSKNSAQYLDSFGGQFCSNDDDKYVEAKYYIVKK